MIRINIEKDNFQQFRKACLEVIDKDIEICYNNNILNYNFKLNSGDNVERDFIGIYQSFVFGGILTRDGELAYLNQAHNYNIQYLKGEGDNMMGMKELNLKTISRNIFTTTYSLKCDKCGHSGVHSVKSAYLPKCPKCASEEGRSPQIKVSDLVHSSSLMDRADGEMISFFREGSEGFRVRLGLSQAQNTVLTNIRVGNNFKNAVLDLFEMENGEVDRLYHQTNPVVMPKATDSVMAPVKKATSTKKAKSKITDDDLVFVLDTIKANFDGKSFKSRDLSPLTIDRFTARQLPSRLTKLVSKGMLSADNSSPKNYVLV